MRRHMVKRRPWRRKKQRGSNGAGASGGRHFEADGENTTGKNGRKAGRRKVRGGKTKRAGPAGWGPGGCGRERTKEPQGRETTGTTCQRLIPDR